MHLFHLFDHSLVGRAGEIGLEWQGKTYTFGEIERRSNQMARLLLAQGIQTGDRVAVYLANRIEMIDLYLAVLKIGAIFVPINILYRERELTHILNDSAPKALVSAEAEGIWQVDALAKAAEEMDEARPQLPKGTVVDGDSPACLVYTSGTTGASKGAVLTHNNFAANAMNIVNAWRLEAKDRLLLALPLFHVHGLGNGVHGWLVAGMRMRLLERFEAAKAAAEFLEFRPTVFFGVPTMYVRLMDIEEGVAREIGSQVRLFVCGSAPLSAQLLEEFRERYGSTILERYGMTETLMNTSNPYYGERRAGSVGLPMPGVSIEIRGEPGAAGELYVKGPNVCAGYWKRPEATAEAFRDGWFRTGDIGRYSEDGYITLEGRRSDLIISGGFNIYPREIEEFLAEQAEIAEAAVAGRADAARGEVPVAYLVRKEGASECTAEELAERCRQALASFKVPKEFHFVEKLPRNALGKVQKHLLGR